MKSARFDVKKVINFSKKKLRINAPRYIPPVEDIDRVILAATDWELDFIQTVYHTLGRLSEILRLAWDDINLEKRTVTLRTRKRKGGQIQSDLVPMSETLHSCPQKKME